jgi:hypothetical protein
LSQKKHEIYKVLRQKEDGTLVSCTPSLAAAWWIQQAGVYRQPSPEREQLLESANAILEKFERVYTPGVRVRARRGMPGLFAFTNRQLAVDFTHVLAYDRDELRGTLKIYSGAGYGGIVPVRVRPLQFDAMADLAWGHIESVNEVPRGKREVRNYETFRSIIIEKEVD